MKKLALAVATSALGAYASAATVTEFANGVLVPYAIHGGSAADSTAVGLTSCAAGTVFWTFFDVNTKHVTDGQFAMTADDQGGGSVDPNSPGFVWSEESGIGLDNVPGYLVFVLDTGGVPGALDSSDEPCLAGNAFQVNQVGNARDVAYLPALPLQANSPTDEDGDFGPADASGVYEPNLLALDENSVLRLSAGANGNDAIYLRYFIAGGASTNIVIWSADDLQGAYTVSMFDTQQNRKSLTLTLANAELNVVDPTTIPGRPANFEDGFIRWDVPAVNDAGDPIQGVFSWSIVDAPQFGAIQSVVNPIRLRSASGNEVRARKSTAIPR